MQQHHPALLVIFDKWYHDAMQSPVFRDHYELLAQVGLTWNVVCSDDKMSIYARKDRLDDFKARLGQLR